MITKSLVQLQADYTFSLEENERKYVELRMLAERELRKALEIRNAVNNLELKITKAIIEHSVDLETINKNYSGVKDV